MNVTGVPKCSPGEIARAQEEQHLALEADSHHSPFRVAMQSFA
jgi:hypothetical protein